jgi:hypothetical protein
MRRSLLAVGLSAALLAPSAGQPTGLGSLWAFLASLWSAASLDEGCGFDPDGRCSPTHLETDAGCGFDPFGLCSPAK